MNLRSITVLAGLLLFFAPAGMAVSLFPDSTGVKTENGRKYIIHKVEPKEGWMSIARRYEVPMNLIIQANPGVDGLKIGQFINVPVLKEIQTAAPVEKVQIQTTPHTEEDRYKTQLYHTVSRGETLYSIAKKYNTTPENIRSRNQLQGNTLSVGQTLIVGYVFKYLNDNPGETADNHTGVKKSKKELRKEKSEARNNEKEAEESNQGIVFSDPVETSNSSKTSNVLTHTKKADPKNEQTQEGVIIAASGKSPVADAAKKAVEYTEKGVASWIDDNDINSSKYYALHRSAPPGTIIKVTNRMNSKTVFVKVVGVLPDTGDNSNIIIKLSRAGAMKLDVIDTRFQAELSYTLYE